MSLTLEAVDEDGALRLARSLPLPNHAHVAIESPDETIAALVKAGGGPTELGWQARLHTRACHAFRNFPYSAPLKL